MPTNEPELVLSPEQPGEPPMKQIAVWQPFKEQMEKLKLTAETLAVTDINDRQGMMLARATRLSFRDIRLLAEEKRKELVSDGKRELAKIDKDAATIWDFCEKQEAHLKELEQFSERETARLAEERRTARAAELAPYLSGPVSVDLANMTDEAYAGLLSDSKGLHAAKLDREQKEREAVAENLRKQQLRADRALEIAPLRHFLTGAVSDLGEMAAETFSELMDRLQGFKQKADEEQERQRLENERLKKEAAKREEDAEKERQTAAAALKKVKDDAAAKAKEVKDKADSENARIAGIAEAQRKETDRLAGEIAAQKQAEAQAAAAKLTAQRKAAAEPSKIKLIAYAAAVYELPIGEVPDSLYKLVAAERDKFVQWIEKQSEAL